MLKALANNRQTGSTGTARGAALQCTHDMRHETVLNETSETTGRDPYRGICLIQPAAARVLHSQAADDDANDEDSSIAPHWPRIGWYWPRSCRYAGDRRLSLAPRLQATNELIQASVT